MVPPPSFPLSTQPITGHVMLLECPNCRQPLQCRLESTIIIEDSKFIQILCCKCRAQITIPSETLTATFDISADLFSSSTLQINNSKKRPAIILIPSAITSSPAAVQYTTNASGTSNSLEKHSGGDHLYALLRVERTATVDQIKKAYYRLAMKHHPDKYQGPDPQGNEEIFKKISEAYQILSNQDSRDRYDRYGDSSAPDGGFAVNPEEFFQQVFGGDRFVDLIGEISIARDFGDALHSQMTSLEVIDGDGDAANSGIKMSNTAEEREERRMARIKKLADNLLHKIDFYVNHPEHALRSGGAAGQEESEKARTEFEKRIREDLDDLKSASYGVELLNSIGYMYSLKARQFLGKDELFGFGRWWNQMREKGHYISETYGTVKSAIQLQSTLAKLQAAAESEAASTDSATTNQDSSKSKKLTSASGKPLILTAEEKARLEELAATKGMDTLWKGSKMEVESVIRDVCDSILCPPDDQQVSKEILKRRAVALRIIGEIYEGVKA